jgi:hypothetical protein
VQDGEKADLGTQMFGIGCNGEQSFRSCPEEEVIDRFPVVESDAGDLFRDSEDDVKILYRQQFRFSALQPLGALRVLTLRAMPVAAGIIRDQNMLALAALFDMAAEGGCTADLDGAHDAQLLAPKPVRTPVSGAVLSKDVSQLESGPGHNLLLRLCLCGLLLAHPVERADSSTDHLRRHGRVARGGVDAAMTEQHLNDSYVGSVFQQMGSEAMT